MAKFNFCIWAFIYSILAEYKFSKIYYQSKLTLKNYILQVSQEDGKNRTLFFHAVDSTLTVRMLVNQLVLIFIS